MSCRWCEHSNGNSWDHGDETIMCRFYPEWREVGPSHICSQFKISHPSQIIVLGENQKYFEHLWKSESRNRKKYEKLAKERFRKIRKLTAKLAEKT